MSNRTTRARRALLLAGAASLIVGAAVPAGADNFGLAIASITADGLQASGASAYPTLSADGNIVVFTSWAEDLVPGDTNGGPDVFALDRETGLVERVSVATDGTQANGWSGMGKGERPSSVSADGRYVAFVSKATNLVADDANGTSFDVFVHDRETGTTEIVSVNSGGEQGEASSWNPFISADGRYVAFETDADTLIGASAQDKVVVYDRTERTLTVHDVSTSSGYNELPVLSADGRWLAYELTQSSECPGSTVHCLALIDRSGGSADFQLLPETVDAAGPDDGSWWPSLSADGRYLAFESQASNIVEGSEATGGSDVFVYDQVDDTYERIEVYGGTSSGDGVLDLQLSADGQVVVFATNTQLVDDDTDEKWDIYAFERSLQAYERVSERSDGSQRAVQSVGYPAVSGDGTWIAFDSQAPDLVAYDENNNQDVFVARMELSAELLRFAGDGRYETAAQTAVAGFPRGVGAVYIATGQNFPDALAGAAAAGAYDSPLLLTQPDTLPPETIDALEQLQPRRIIVLGGTVAVSAAVETELAPYATEEVTRLDGPNRFATAAAVSKDAFPYGNPPVYVATGFNFPDALAGTGAAVKAGGPILLVTPDQVPAETATELKRLKPPSITILGGTTAVSEAVESALAAYTDGDVVRLSGEDRYLTAAKIVGTGFGDDAADRVVVLATGQNFPDALAGSAVAGMLGAPVVLVPSQGTVPQAIIDQVQRLDPRHLLVLGGEKALPQSIVDQVWGSGGGTGI